jgi:predicted RNA methylase
MRSEFFARILMLLAAVSLPLHSGSAAEAHSFSSAERTPEPEQPQYHSNHLEGDIIVLPDVFFPTTAEHRVLPFMKAHREHFEGSAVLDIGTGSGIIALYAAKLGAKRVIATDISETALECTRLNAERFGYSEIIEPRLVPPSDMSAYSVIDPGEKFDFIISNPPYFLDFDAAANTDETDTGDLGFSIIRGLKHHLTPGGQAVLLYGSTFYHQIIVKFAQHKGYAVDHHDPAILYSKEVLTLWNYYLQRILEREGLAPDDLRFRKGDITALVPRKSKLEEGKSRPDPYYSGMIVIKNMEPGED